MPRVWVWCDVCGAYTPHQVEDLMDGFVWVRCYYCGAEDHVEQEEVIVE